MAQLNSAKQKVGLVASPPPMEPQNSMFSQISVPDGHGVEQQPTMLERRESQVIEEQLPGFMQVDESDHKHRHHYRAALRTRLAVKNNALAFLSELIGSILFLFMSFGIATIASNGRAASQGNNVDGGSQSLSQNAPPDTSALLFSSLGFGFSLAVNAWTFYRVSGGLFNPAVTLALFLTGTLGWFQLIHLTIAQIVGAIAAAALCDGLLPGPINARTSLSSGITVAQGFWLEFFLTAQLIFAIFMLAAEKHKGTFLAPVGIGLALFISELLGTNYTSGSLNPARSFGPDVVLGKFDTYHWIYWIAPYSAALVTAGFYSLLKYMQYESVNTGQDADETKQVMRDSFGNFMGAIETMDAAEFHYMKPITHANHSASGIRLNTVNSNVQQRRSDGTAVSGSHDDSRTNEKSGETQVDASVA